LFKIVRSLLDSQSGNERTVQRTLFVPIPKPVMLVLKTVSSVTKPPPLNTVHCPLPLTFNAAPDNFAVLAHTKLSLPLASANTALLVTSTLTASLQLSFTTVQVKVVLPLGKPLTWLLRKWASLYTNTLLLLHVPTLPMPGWFASKLNVLLQPSTSRATATTELLVTLTSS
jgi:hypothetical protein